MISYVQNFWGGLMENRMRAALGMLGAIVKSYFPAELKSVLLAYGTELDRLRAEVDDLRSKIEKE